MLWSGLVSWVGAFHRNNLTAPFPLGQNCRRKITILYNLLTPIFICTARAPSFKFGFGPFTLFLGSEGRLNCEPDAVPQPTFEWSKVAGDNQGGINSGGRYKLFSNGTLVIANVTQNDEGKYKCKATNLLGSDSATANVSVLGK